MNLAAAIQEFVTHKRALGLVYWRTEYHLRSLLGQVGDVELRGISVQQVEQFLKGRQETVTRFWLSKYRAAGVFFRYAISRGYMESAPLPKSVPKMPAQFVPYLYSIDEMRRLLAIPDSCYPPRSILSPLTMRTLLLLLYGTGLRLGEGASLKWADVDLEEGLLTVRETKFFKSRLLPVSSDIVRVLRAYRDQQWPTSPAPDTRVFCTRRRAAMTKDHAFRMFQWLRREAGVLRFDGGRFQPRLHDLRHTFAVTRLVTWYREGKDVQRLLPHLSVYLGHVNIESTAYYLTMTKELLQEANRCFERYALAEVEHD